MVKWWFLHKNVGLIQIFCITSQYWSVQLCKIVSISTFRYMCFFFYSNFKGPKIKQILEIVFLGPRKSSKTCKHVIIREKVANRSTLLACAAMKNCFPRFAHLPCYFGQQVWKRSAGSMGQILYSTTERERKNQRCESKLRIRLL